MAPASRLGPPAAHGAMPRPALTKELATLSRCGSLWVEGPAGSGKTTAVAIWLRRDRRPTLWCRLGAADADPAHLFERLARAAGPERGAATRLPRWVPGATIDTFAARFFEVLLSMLPRRAALVLDDAHALGEDASPILLSVVAVASPVTRVLVSRRPLPGALARATVEGRIAALDPRHLALSLADAEAYARRKLPRSRAAEAAALAHACDGWFAGLTALVARARSERLAAPDLVNDELFAYLATEVVGGFDGRTRRALEAAALLGSGSAAEIAEACGPGLTEAAVGRALESLRRHGYFVERHGTGEYRVHMLLQHYLLAQLELPARAAERGSLTRACSEVLERRGDFLLAFERLVDASDPGAQRAFVLRVAPELWRRRAWVALRRLLEHVREQDDEPNGLTAWRGRALLAVSPAAAARCFARCFAIAVRDADRALAVAAWCGQVQACLHQGRTFAPLDALLESLRGLDPIDAHTDPDLAASGLLLVAHRGADAATRAAFEAVAERVLLASTSDRDTLAVGSALITHFVFSGQIARALAVRTRTGALADSDDSAAASLAFDLASARLLLLRADHQGGRAAIERGERRLEATGLPFWRLSLLFTRVVLEIGESNREAASRALGEIEVLALRGRPLDIANFLYASALFAHFDGRQADAEALSELTLRSAHELGYPLGIGLSFALAARVALAQGEPERARTLLERARAEGQLPELTRTLLELVSAQLEIAVGDRVAAALHLQRGFGALRAGGVLALTFLHPDRALADLCVEALRQGIEREHVIDMVRARGLRPSAPPRGISGWPWPLAIRVLGPVATEPTFRTGLKSPRVPLALLGALAVLSDGSGRGVPVVALADALWPDVEGDRSRHSLEMALHRLRKLLPVPHAIELAGDHVCLDFERVNVDLWSLRAILRRPPDGASAREIGRLYGGALLSGFEQPFAVHERRRLHAELEQYAAADSTGIVARLLPDGEASGSAGAEATTSSWPRPARAQR